MPQIRIVEERAALDKPIIFLFSGQGSQYYQMGRQLFNENSTFKKWMLFGNEIIYRTLKVDLLKKLYDEGQGISKLFDQTLLTHPAIFLFEYALAQVVLERNVFPDYVLGTSLGEFVAAVVVGVLSFEEALFAVLSQAETFERQIPRGGMLAVLGPAALYEETGIQDFTQLASVNFDNHFVVSGPREDLERAEARLRMQGVRTQQLAVSHPFHSSDVDVAKGDYLAKIKHLTFKSANIPWISGCKEHRLASCTAQYLWEIVRLPILFQQIIRTLEAKGNFIYLDLGPSGTLATLVKYNLFPGSTSQALALCTPFGARLASLDLLRETTEN